MTADWPLTARALDLLAADGISTSGDTFLSRCDKYRRLSSTWNSSAKLMSKVDLESRFDAHIADSLSLVPSIRSWFDTQEGGTYCDIGSGGGFPAIPIALLLPDVPVVLVERSEKKMEFLTQVLLQLELRHAKVVRESFPSGVLPPAPRLYTARATERASILDKSIARLLESGDVYLAERKLSAGPVVTALVVEEIADEFQRAGLRRGKLYRVYRPQST